MADDLDENRSELTDSTLSPLTKKQKLNSEKIDFMDNKDNDFVQSESPSKCEIKDENVQNSGISSTTQDLETTFQDTDDKQIKISCGSPATGSQDEISSCSSSDEDDCFKSDPLIWIQKQIEKGINPRAFLKNFITDDSEVPNDIDDLSLWKAILNILTEPDPRTKLTAYNTIDDCVDLIQKSMNIIILTGAGISVSCGIPDFRSKNGIYARLAVEYPNLPDPQAMFDIDYFKKDQRPFFKFAKEIYPGSITPSTAHYFIKKIEQKDKLLRNYTQNIDALEHAAGINKVIECHGSFSTASCMNCKVKVDSEAIREDVMNQKIPMCKSCPVSSDMSIMKPDIVFFGEGLSPDFHDKINEDKDKCDLLIVMGSSMKVRPVALIPNSLPDHVPQILINKEPLNHLNFDICLFGNCNNIVKELCCRLGDGWNDICPNYDQQTITCAETLIKEHEKMLEERLTLTGLESTSKNDLKTEESISDINNDTSELENSSNCIVKRNDTINDIKEIIAEENIGTLENSKSTIDDKIRINLEEEKRLQVMRKMWLPGRMRISSHLPENSFAFLPPHIYIFKDADYLYDLDNDSESSSDEDSTDSLKNILENYEDKGWSEDDSINKSRENLRQRNKSGRENCVQVKQSEEELVKIKTNYAEKITLTENSNSTENITTITNNKSPPIDKEKLTDIVSEKTNDVEKLTRAENHADNNND